MKVSYYQMNGLLICLLGYFLGSLPFGLWIARTQGVDLLIVGSKNIGATNVARNLGFKWAAIVFLLDTLKGFIPSALGTYYLNSLDLGLLGGISAVIGHSISPFIRFKGGKSICTAWGALLGTTWMTAAIVCITFLVLAFISKKISVGSIAAAIATILCGIVFPITQFAKVIHILMGLFVIYRHKSNIQRLIKKEEPNFKWGKL